MKKVGTTSSGTVIVEMTSDQFDALARLQSPQDPAPSATTVVSKKMTADERVLYIKERIDKLKPKKKDGLVNSIIAMFQFDGGIKPQDVNQVLQTLEQQGFFTIDNEDRVNYMSS